MDSEQREMQDRVNLPADAVTVSLWDTLHDGDVLAIESDLLARSLTIVFQVGYVSRFQKLPDETRFVLKFSGVRSVQCLKSASWPGEFTVPPGTSREDERKLIDDYHSKWREESFAWGDLERTTGAGLEVSNALLATADAFVALQLGLLVGDGSYVDAFIRAERIDFFVGEDSVTLGAFSSLGEAYWEAFANRKPSGSDI